MAPRPVVGIADHYAQAELVTVGLEGGRPAILDRRRVRLIEPGLPTAPYHHEGLAWPLVAVEPLVARVRASVAEHCRAALSALQDAHAIGAVVLRESPYPRLPDSVAEVLASYPLTCAADGMLYREGLAEAAADLGLGVTRYPRKSDPITAAIEALGADVPALLAEFGRRVGRPWTKEHREAAAAALRILRAGEAT